MPCNDGPSSADAGMPLQALLEAPHLNQRHIDGPLLTWAGLLHWLTPRERISLNWGLTTIKDIAVARWPQRRLYVKRKEIER